MQVAMVMFRADGDKRTFQLKRDVTVIGRREDCGLRIPLGEVSRKHCRLIKEDDGTLRLEDLGSSNGTYHNGRRIQEAVIEPGDSIQIGPVVFVVQIDNYPPADELQPVVAATAANASAGEIDALAPTAQSEIGESSDEFDPMSALQAPEDSAVDFELEDSAAIENIQADLERSRGEQA